MTQLGNKQETIFLDSTLYTERILELLKRAYTYLFHVASRHGHWNEVRCTALAAMCLQFREEGDSLWLSTVRNWLIQSQIKDGEQAGSWGEEIWDTALAIIALKELEVSSKDEVINTALHWIAKLFSMNGRNNWHDELWETSWALIALFRCGREIPTIDIENAIVWLSSFQDSQGKIVAPHYTAYYMLVEYYSRRVNLSDTARSLLRNNVAKCISYLLDSLTTAHPDILWTGEHWSNGQILLAICIRGDFPVENIHLLERCISWFETTQEDLGNWSDIEDTASAILGLLALLHLIISKTVDPPPPSSKIWQEVGFRLRKAVPAPRLSLKRNLVEYDKETGYTTININSKARQFIIATFLFLFVSALGWIANVLQIWQVIHGSH